MARKSAASLSIIPQGVATPPPAPQDLSEAETALWVEIVESKPVDWFGPDSIPVLKEYVRASLLCDVLAAKVKRAIEGGEDEQVTVNVVKLFLDMRDKEARRAVSLATKLRLTPQSRYGPRTAERQNAKAGGKRPWQG